MFAAISEFFRLMARAAALAVIAFGLALGFLAAGSAFLITGGPDRSRAPPDAAFVTSASIESNAPAWDFGAAAPLERIGPPSQSRTYAANQYVSERAAQVRAPNSALTPPPEPDLAGKAQN